MLNILTGRASVARIFWMGYILYPILFGLAFGLFFGLLAVVTQTPPGFTADGNTLFNSIYYALSALYFFVILRAVIKSSTTGRRPGFWSWIAVLLIALAIVGSLILAFAPRALQSVIPAQIQTDDPATAFFQGFVRGYNENRASSGRASSNLTAEVETLNARLPLALDSNTTLEEATLSGTRLRITARASGTLSDSKLAQLERYFQSDPERLRDNCATYAPLFEAGASTVTYVFTYPTDVIHARLTPRHCAEITAAE